MTSFSLKLEEALEALNQIGPALLLSKNKEDALKRIIELARKALQADACTLVLIDTHEREGYLVLNCIDGEASEEIASGPLVCVGEREFPTGQASSAEGAASSLSPQSNIEASSNHARAALPGPQRTFSFALRAKDETLGYLHFDYHTSRSLPEHEKRLCEVL